MCELPYWYAAKWPAEDRRASFKKAHSNYADTNQEVQASKLTVENEAQDDVKEAAADGDKEADKINDQVNREDADFDLENAAEDEVEPVPADKADDAGELLGCMRSGDCRAALTRPLFVVSGVLGCIAFPSMSSPSTWFVGPVCCP